MAILGKIVSVCMSIWMAVTGGVPVQGISPNDIVASMPVTNQVQTHLGEWICKQWPNHFPC
ncbi:Uncharacterised protein [Mobiluncus mulieris]|nr:Uncharacterised protein [Mobiluncus mulieris]